MKADTDKESEMKIMGKLLTAWEKLRPYLSVKGNNPMLLIVWDEAKTLVKTWNGARSEAEDG